MADFEYFLEVFAFVKGKCIKKVLHAIPPKLRILKILKPFSGTKFLVGLNIIQQ